MFLYQVIVLYWKEAELRIASGRRPVNKLPHDALDHFKWLAECTMPGFIDITVYCLGGELTSPGKFELPDRPKGSGFRNKR